MSEAPINRPEDVVVMFLEACNHRDPDALAAHFDKDAEFVNVTGLWWHTREEIRSAHAYGSATLLPSQPARRSKPNVAVVLRFDAR